MHTCDDVLTPCTHDTVTDPQNDQDPTSKYDPGHWTAPPDDGSSDDSSPRDVTPTRASLTWTSGVPDLTITTSDPSSAATSDTPEPGAYRTFVDVVGLRAMLEGLLSHSQSLIAQQNSLADLVHSASTSKSIWGQNATEDQQSYVHQGGADGGSYTQHDKIVSDGPVQEAGTAFQQSIQPMMDHALNQIDQALYTVGQFMAGLQSTTEQYANTDAAATAPDLGPLVSPDDLTP